ncbi:hypothetical protein CsatB_028029 [Cannabis sativa]
MASSSSSTSSIMVGGDDRISNLPDSIINDILSFLPTQDVVRTCVLSKRWKLIWYSVPTIFFSNKNIVFGIEWENEQEKFYNYVEKYFKQRKKGMHRVLGSSCITSFKLEMKGFYQISNAHLINKWLAFIVKKNKIKEISLSIGKSNRGYYYHCLPKVFLNNTKFLTNLELCGVMLDKSHSFNFPLLKTLSLENIKTSYTVKYEPNVVFKFLLGCPSLEKFRLCWYGLLQIDGMHRLRSLSLKNLELVYTYVKDLQIDAINLESLVLTSNSSIFSNSFANINLSTCNKIKVLSMNDLSITHVGVMALNSLISNNPLLENLTLSIMNVPCYYDECHLKISSQHLKSFYFKNCYSREAKVTIESAPELEYFCYEGTIDTIISIESSNLLSGKMAIYEDCRDYDAEWYIDMLNFLSNFNCSWNTLSLHVKEFKALIWPEKFKRVCYSPLLNLKHLRVITKDSNPERMSDLKNSLMWISPSLETLSINKMQIF